MNSFSYRCFSSPSLPFPPLNLRLSLKPITSVHRKPIYAKIPARDRIVDFGKYKGRMLGTLPSKYLKWVSKNLRARDFEEWAKLADEVLEDPVYKDRLEWEFAERILEGDDSRVSRSENPVSDLLEMSERFGWDNENKVAWNKIDFALLGSSRGGRIPRARVSQDEDAHCLGPRKLGFLGMVSGSSNTPETGTLGLNSGRRRLSGSGTDSGLVRKGEMGKECGVFEKKKMDSLEGRKVGYLSMGARFYDNNDEGFEKEVVRGRRDERRERQRLKRHLQMQKLKSAVGVKKDGIERENPKRNLDSNPFPGRDALLSKLKGQD